MTPSLAAVDSVTVQLYVLSSCHVSTSIFFVPENYLLLLKICVKNVQKNPLFVFCPIPYWDWTPPLPLHRIMGFKCVLAHHSTFSRFPARQGHLSTVIQLLRYGADPSLADGEGFCSLHLAVLFQHMPIAAYLMAKGQVGLPAHDYSSLPHGQGTGGSTST